MQQPGSQEAPKIFGIMGTRDSMEIDTLSGNEESGGEDEIAAEIEQQKKEQKIAQIKTELHCLKKHKA